MGNAVFVLKFFVCNANYEFIDDILYNYQLFPSIYILHKRYYHASQSRPGSNSCI